jgi:hypothetical protein
MSWDEALADLAARKAASRSMGDERLARHRGAGKLDVRARIDHLLDPGSFLELGTLVGGENAPADAIVMGSGRIDGRPVMVAAEDFTVKAGTISASANAKRYPGGRAVRRRPNEHTAASISTWPPSGVDTSLASAIAEPPSATISATTSAAGAAASAPDPGIDPTRSLTTTWAPPAASRRAWARPMPRPAPVTTATRPSKRCSHIGPVPSPGPGMRTGGRSRPSGTRISRGARG